MERFNLNPKICMLPISEDQPGNFELDPFALPDGPLAPAIIGDALARLYPTSGRVNTSWEATLALAGF